MATVKASNPLLASKQSEVAQRVLTAGFSRDDFQFIDLQARQHITALRHRSGQYRFDFYPGDNWIVNYSPAEHTSESGEIGVGDWGNVLTRVDWWLSYIKREQNVTDPWAVMSELSTPFSMGSDPTDNSVLSTSERDAVARQLAEIKAYLLEEGLKAESDRHAVVARLDDIEEGLSRFGRRDWIWFALGVLMQLALVGYVTPEGVRYVVEHWFTEARLRLSA